MPSGLLRVLGVGVGLFALLVVLAWVGQRQLIYLPDRSTPAPLPGVEIEDVALRTADDLDLGAWFLPAEGEAVSTVVVANGNAGNRAARLPMAQGLAARGHAVLLTDYRGYGGNPGSPSEAGLVADLRAASAHVAGRDDVDADRVVYLGESLGTAVVAALAAEQTPVALVLRSPFPSLSDVGRRHYPFLPVRTLLRDRFPVSDDLAGYGGPTLVIAGGADRIVPADLSRQVADAAGAEYVEIAGADHNDPALFDGAELLDAIDAFIHTSLPAP